MTGFQTWALPISALLDLLFLYREEPRTENSLKALLTHNRGQNAEKKDDKERSEHTFEELRAAVMDEDSDQDLAGFILSTYQPEMAADLMSLVSRTLPEFREWIAVNSRRHWKMASDAEPGQYSSDPVSSDSSSSQTSATK